MVNIAALLFRIKVNNDKSQLVMIPKMLKELVPGDQLKAMSENEWKKVRGPFLSRVTLSIVLEEIRSLNTFTLPYPVCDARLQPQSFPLKT